MPADELGAAVVGMGEGPAVSGHQGHVAQPGPGRVGNDRSQPAAVDYLGGGVDPRLLSVGAGCGLVEVAVPAWPGVQPAEAGLARLCLRAVEHRAVDLDQTLGAVHQTVVGYGHHRRSLGEDGEQVGHQPVAGPQLGVVVLPEAVLVGHDVEALVVGVDEGLPRGQQVPHLHREARQHLVAEAAGVAQVGAAEPRLAVLGLLERRRALPAE